MKKRTNQTQPPPMFTAPIQGDKPSKMCSRYFPRRGLCVSVHVWHTKCRLWFETGLSFKILRTESFVYTFELAIIEFLCQNSFCVLLFHHFELRVEFDSVHSSGLLGPRPTTLAAFPSELQVAPYVSHLNLGLQRLFIVAILNHTIIIIIIIIIISSFPLHPTFPSP